LAEKVSELKQLGLGSRAVRGGSWNNNHQNARCANRNRNIPDNFNNNIGFRVVSHDSEHELAGKLR
jgi:formylglycine-generating enzyme required for sulfatase activity